MKKLTQSKESGTGGTIVGFKPTAEMRKWLYDRKAKTGSSISFMIRGAVLQAMEMEKREGVRK